MADREMPKISSDQYPSNSNTSKNTRHAKQKRPTKADIPEEFEPTEPQHEKRVKTVAKGKAKKQSLIKKLGKSIIEDSVESVKERAFNDIIVPGIKSLLFDTVTDMADAILFGNSGYSGGYSSRARSRRGRDEKTSYSGYYEEKNRRRNRQSDRARNRRDLDYSLEPDDIIVDTRRAANNALAEVNECIRKYGQASIADLYDACELTSDWTDGQYGWNDIRGARIRSVRDGFMIIMPPTIELD